jgi:pimeloyl-ACP methyl ester carboxylesterase
MTLAFVERAGVRLAYDLRGSGPLVALVQGLGLPGKMWLGLPGGLARRGYSVVTPDCRGTGSSDVPLPPYTMAALAADLAAVIDAVDRGPALVVAVSMGGMVAQRLALNHPERVRGLVLAATTCGLPHGRLPSPLFPLLVLRSLVDDDAIPAIRRLMLAPGRFDAQPEIFDVWDREQVAAEMPWQGILGHLTAAAVHSSGFELDRIRCPTVVLTGEGDQIMPPVNSRILARRIPGARLMVLPGAGHAFPLEQPEAIPDAMQLVEEPCEP